MADYGQRDLQSLTILLSVVWTLFLFYYLLSYIRNSTNVDGQFIHNSFTMFTKDMIHTDHVFCEHNYMDSLFYKCDITNSTNICIMHVYLIVLLQFLYDQNNNSFISCKMFIISKSVIQIDC